MVTETERKFLIRLPTPDRFAELEADGILRVCGMAQIYLTSEGEGERRIRKITENGIDSYIYTEKFPLEGTKISRLENEYEITSTEYDRLMDKAYSQLQKTRYSFPYKDHMIEIDVYPHEIGGDALDGLAVLEIELDAETEKFDLPDWIEVIRELSGTREFSNKKLAKKVVK